MLSCSLQEGYVSEHSLLFLLHSCWIPHFSVLGIAPLQNILYVETHKLALKHPVQLQVRTSPELGKYLVASRDLSPGDVIISEGPLVVGPKLHNEQPLCLGCLAPARYDSDYRCPKCLWPCCGPSCTADPKVHAPECAILCLQAKRNLAAAARKEAAPYNYDAVTPLRCLLLQRRNPRKWEQILQMEAHLRHRGPGTDVYR